MYHKPLRVEVMQNKDYDIRKLTIDDLDQYNDLLRYAFQVTE